MKTMLIITLVALVVCGNFGENALDFIGCVLKNENIKTQAINLFNSFKTKDISNIISTAISVYLSVKDDIKECLEPMPALRSLGGCVNQKYYDNCRKRCKGMLHMICKKDCYNAWCL